MTMVRTLLTLAILLAWGSAGAATSREIPVAFESAGAMLEGTLFLPQGRPGAAAVLIHGSVQPERRDGLARDLADNGIAILTYGARGVGRSGSSSENESELNAQSITIAAGDAAAAFTALQRHRQTAEVPSGYLGVGHAGWTAPLAAARSSNVRFIGLWSGPVMTTSEARHFSAMSLKNPDLWQMQSAAEIARFLASVPRRADDLDPASAIATLEMPALWLFGEEDIETPVALSVRRLIALMQKGKTNLSYQVIEHQEHDLVGSATQPAFAAMVAWVKAVSAGK